MHLSGPFAGPWHDFTVMEESSILDIIREKTRYPPPHDNEHMFIFGDSGYYTLDHRDVLVTPFTPADELINPDCRRWNYEASSVRMEIEHYFGIVVNNWKFLTLPDKQKMQLMLTGPQYACIVFLTNLLNCVSPNQIAQRFSFTGPTLQQYLDTFLTE